MKCNQLAGRLSMNDLLVLLLLFLDSRLLLYSEPFGSSRAISGKAWQALHDSPTRATRSAELFVFLCVGCCCCSGWRFGCCCSGGFGCSLCCCCCFCCFRVKRRARLSFFFSLLAARISSAGSLARTSLVRIANMAQTTRLLLSCCSPRLLSGAR